MSRWPTAPFQDLAASDPASFSIGPFGSRIRKDNYVTKGVPVVRGVNLARGIFHDADFVYVSDEFADGLRSCILLSGDLIFTHRGTIGQVSMISRRAKHPRYILSSSQVKARLDESRAIPEFYYYWFSCADGQRALLANASTVGVPGIASPLATIRSIQVPLPPRPEQLAIVSVLRAFDDKIAANGSASLTALRLANAIYGSAAQSSDWIDVPLEQAARWYSGGTPSTSRPEYWGGDLPWISAMSLKSPWIEDSDRRLTPLGAANGTRIAPRGSIMFVVRGSSLNTEFRIGITQREVAFGQDCKALVPIGGIAADLLLHAIRSRTSDVLDLVDETSIGAGRLATDLMAKLKVRVPREPDPVVEKLVSLNATCVGLQREGQLLVAMRDALLPELMSGEVRVRDAENVVEEAL